MRDIDIRHFLQLPRKALKVISTEGWGGFRTRVRIRWRGLRAAQQTGKTRSYGAAYSAEASDCIGEIRKTLATDCQPTQWDRADFIDVVVPIFNAYDEFLVCLCSLLRYQDVYRITLLNDCSTDTRITDLLRTLKGCDQNRLRVETNTQNLGYLRTVNKGMRMTSGDVILLNTDTVVTSGWARKMRACAHSDERIATVTPFTNNGRMCSIPGFLQDNDIPDGFTVDSFGECVERASSNRYPELVTAVGFCMYIRRDAMDELGYFDEVNFEMGYGEEVEFSFRAARSGYRNVLCDNTFVFHKGGASFLDMRHDLMERHHNVLSDKYPEYWAAVARFEESNPLEELHDRLKREMRMRGPARFKLPG